MEPSANHPPGAADLADLLRRVERLERAAPADRLCLCVFSGDLDRQMAALTIATGAAAAGMEVQLFFTFWATAALRDPRKRTEKSLLGRLFDLMLPRGPGQLPLSQLQMMGLGPTLIRHLMKKQGAASLEDLFQIAGELGVKIGICTMSMELMELKPEEFLDYPHLSCCGVTTFIEQASTARATLFI